MADSRLEKRIERLERRQHVCEDFIRRSIRSVPGGHERVEAFDQLIKDAGEVPVSASTKN